ncbi:MAG: response regulator transcription factor [Flavobacteriia bacterium]|nr:response regulator transcription factor [Flavobacteriia bacterium]
MNSIKSIIIDDESANRTVLDSFLKKYCPVIEVVGSAESVEVGYRMICDLSPDLVFLDVRMPSQSGFDLLRMFDEIPFHVIFITAYDEYAIQAFQFNAIDYLLKPIDYQKLIKSVAKVEETIRLKKNASVIHFVNSVDDKQELLRSITLHKKDKVQFVDIDQIAYIQADRNYCEVITSDNERLVSSKTLLDYEQLLQHYSNFLRINKSVMINIRFIREYTKGSTCFIYMKNGSEELEVSRRKKGEILQFLKGEGVLLN